MGKFYLNALYNKFKILAGFRSLCVLLFLPIFSYAASSVDQDPSMPNQFSGVVHVSSSAVIYGADQMHVITEKDLSEKPIVDRAKQAVKPVAISKEAIDTEKKIKEEKFKKEFSPVNAQVFLNNSSTDSSLLAAKQTVNCQATVSTSSPQKQVLNATFADIARSICIDPHLVKQKYYTSVSYLLFGKNGSSSLRAPPISA